MPAAEIRSTTTCCDNGFVARAVERHRLGLKTPDGGFAPCRISLTPWRITRDQWRRLTDTGRALSRLFARIAERPDRLLDWRPPATESPGLPDRLFAIVADRDRRDVRAHDFGLIRHDFLMTPDRQWRLVESNAIAAGMGPFGEATAATQAQLPENAGLEFIPNPATQRQAAAMARAARTVAGERRPEVVFLVPADEDNVYDQAKLKDALAALGVRTRTLTLAEFSRRARTGPGHRLVFAGGRPVDLVYFRTGYNLDDYLDADGRPDRLLGFRAWLERHRVAVAPGIALQLATSKWIQMRLSRLRAGELTRRFGLSARDARLAANALATESMPCPGPDELRRRLATGHWLLKGPGEGGGNVLARHESDDEPAPGSLLMRKLEPAPRPGGCLVSQARLRCEPELVAEIGVFTAGPEHEHAGYLVRTKPAGALEAGVHWGKGMLDALAFTERTP